MASCEAPDGENEGVTKLDEAGKSNFEVWSSPGDPISHTGHAIAFDWESNDYLYWMASDMRLEPATNYPKQGIFFVDEEERIHLRTILDTEVVLRKIDLV